MLFVASIDGDEHNQTEVDSSGKELEKEEHMLNRAIGSRWMLLGVFLAVHANAQTPTPIGPANLPGTAQAKPPEPDYPPLEKVIDGFEEVKSADGEGTLYQTWTRRKDGSVYVALGPTFESQRVYLALTLSGGSTFAGLQSGEYYLRWKQYDKTLALIEPQLETRSTGDRESTKISRAPLYRPRPDRHSDYDHDGPKPVIDLKSLLLGNLNRFFGTSGNTRLASLTKLKVFPQNIEVAWELPTSSGKLQTFHFSLSTITGNSAYKPREADPRVGYFYHRLCRSWQVQRSRTQDRYITRWHLEKLDSSLKISPPKQPIVFYIEHTTPLRYRRW